MKRAPYQLAALSALAALALLAAPARAEAPRYQRDARCLPAVALDAPGALRQCRSCGFLSVSLPAASTAADCAYACCGDWSCQSFQFTPAGPAPPRPSGPASSLTGSFVNHDSLRGDSGAAVTEAAGGVLTAASADPARAFWSTAVGRRVNDTAVFLVFDGDAANNRSGAISADGMTIFFSRVAFDPPGFSQNFSRVIAPTNATCVFQDDILPSQPAPPGSAAVSGVRAFLPGQAPPFPQSSFFASAALNSTALYGVDGDEFPATWASDGFLYSGAGDNNQRPRGIINASYNSPASMMRVAGSPTDATYPAHAFEVTGSPFAPANSAFAKANCPSWGSGLANIKSSGALFVNGTLYWAVSCFNYGDDPDFNRQRYGPAWIVRSTNFGKTWDDTNTPVFAGRLAAPRFVQAGQAFADAPDGYVYAFFPGTTGNASFFECNDAVWLGRVPVAQIWTRAAYEFVVGFGADGTPQWDSDDSLAAPVYAWPLHTSVQNAVYHPALKRYLLANWVWISMDGNPRPDHSVDERNARTARQRTQLVMLEAPAPWGPFSAFLRDDNWSYSDGSSGAYTPVLMPSWLDAGGAWLVSTQCCGNPQFPPTNHYSFNAQRLDWALSGV